MQNLAKSKQGGIEYGWVYMNLSVIILTKNEEHNIVDCIENVSFADEILIIDDYSQDRTIEIIKKLSNKKIKIFQRNLQDNFSDQRNFGLSKSTKDWVLFLDADERISLSLQYEILSVLNDSIAQVSGYYIRRRDVIWGRKLMYGETGNIKHLRLAKKNVGRWEGRIHEVWRVRGKIGKLRNPLLHCPHQEIREFLREINFYTNIRAEELYRKKVKANLASIIFYPLGKFIVNFFLKRGFLDGIEGFVFAIFMSFHSFLVRGKLWLLWHKK